MEFYYLAKGPERTCQPGRGGMGLTPKREYLYFRPTGVIVQMVSPTPPGLERIQTIKGDQKSIDFLEAAILDPEWRVRPVRI